MADMLAAADHLEALVHRAHVLVFDLREAAPTADEERHIQEGRAIAREMEGLFHGR